MASAALGIVGGLLFGPIGYLVGSTLGAILSPAKGANGPRWTDLKYQSSSYGTMIPIPFGTMRYPAIVAWATDYQEHSHGGGKGGGPETFTYTVSFAAKFCKSAKKLIRVWADGEIIYSTIVGEETGDDLPIVVYTGKETDGADPTMQAILGAGNVTAFRDDFTIVWTDWDITKYGRLPNINAEIAEHVGPIPWRVFSYTTQHAGPNYANQAFILGADYAPDPVTGVNVLSIAGWNSAVHGPSFTLDTYQLDGTHIDQPINIANIPDYAGGTGINFIPVINSAHISFASAAFAGNIGVSAWFVDGTFFAGPLGTPFTDDIKAVMNWPYLKKENLYAPGGPVSGPGFIFRWPCPGGVAPAAFHDASYDFNTFTGISGTSLDCFIIQSDDDFIWVSRAFHTNPCPVLWKFDLDLNLIQSWTVFQSPHAIAGGSLGGVIYEGNLCVEDTTFATAVLYPLDDPAFPQIGSLPVAVGSYVYLANGLVLVPDGVISLNPPVVPTTVAAAVSKISQLCGLTAGDIDVSRIPFPLDGFAINQQSAGHDAITTLQNGFFFDGIESTTQMKFVPRGGPSVITIPDEDLAAQEGNAASPALVTTVRAQEEELPQDLSFTYVSALAFYQKGNQIAQRQITRSQDARTIDLGISFSDMQAKFVVETLLYNGWMERMKYTINLPRKYAYLEPTDVVTARSLTMRLVAKHETQANVVNFDGVASHQSVWVGGYVSSAGSGITPPTTNNPANVNALLLDIPLTDDGDSPAGFYVVADRRCNLYKSSDGGGTYNVVAQVPAATAIGTAQSALPDFGDGSTVFDEYGTVTVLLTSGTLSSASALAVLNGDKEYLLGNEIIQSKNSVLIAPNTYQLSGHLRGRRGTEWAMPGHVAGERFAALPGTDVPGVTTELYQSRLYKAAAPGSSLTAAPALAFTNSGQRLKCYSPVGLIGGINGAGDVILQWVRRTRIGGAWMPFVDAPLSETAELYVVQIWNSTYTVCARVISGLTSPTFTYTGAMQVTDFGAQQQTIFWTVGQVGQLGLGQQAVGATSGAGGSNAAPLAPVPPYNSSPPTSGCTLPVVNSSLNWATPGVSIYSPGLTPDVEWVVKLTTGAITGGSSAGTITMAEYGGGPVQRTAVLALSPCGSPLTPSCSEISVSPTFPFFMTNNPNPAYWPTLLPFTDYYISVLSQASGQMFAQLQLPH